MRISAAILVFSLVSVTPALVMGTPIAQWTFESTVPTTAGPYSPEVGSGSASGFHAGAAVYSSSVGNGSAHSYSSTVWAVGDYWQFQVSTIGFENTSISWDQASSNTGPGVFGLFWSLTGVAGSFAQVGGNYGVLANASPNPLWNGTTSSSLYSYNYNLSLITALNNASTVYFQLIDESTTSANGSTVAGGGTDRIDNFTVTGAQIPDSTSGLACLVCSVGLLEVLRRMTSVSSPLPQKHA